MNTKKLFCYSLILSSVAENAAAFSPNSIKPMSVYKSQEKSALDAHAINTEDEAMYYMMKAVDCANSDECSIEEAREYMREIVHVQSSCASGTLVGHDVCENPVFASEVIASLRQKIENGTTKSARPFGTGEVLLLSSIYLFMYMASTVQNANDLMPFTSEEWMWSLRDGYFLDMVGYTIKHHADGVVPFTAEEWGWAIRDGYLPQMLAESFKHGGYLL